MIFQMEKMNHYIETYSYGLPKSLTELFESINFVKKLEKGEEIYSQGEKAESFFYLKRGKVRVYMTSENGMEKTLSIISRGAILGEAAFFDGMPRVSSASAMQKTEIVVITRQILENAFRTHPGIALELLKLQAMTIRMLSLQVDSITFRDAESRIANFLLESAEERGDNRYVFATQEEIGTAVAVSRVTASRIINEFSRQGLLSTGYGKITINNKKALEAIASKA